MSWEIKLVNTQDRQSFKKTPLVDSFCCLSCELFSTLPISSLLLPQAWIHLWWLYTLTPSQSSKKKPSFLLCFIPYIYIHTQYELLLVAGLTVMTGQPLPNCPPPHSIRRQNESKYMKWESERTKVDIEYKKRPVQFPAFFSYFWFSFVYYLLQKYN